MKEGLLFLVLLLVIGGILWVKREGFQSGGGAPVLQSDVAPKGANPALTVPLVSPRYQTLVSGEVKPFAPDSTKLLAPPPGQLASVGSRPAEDPALEKAKGGRVKSVFESMVGFFDNEAPGLQKIGDPSVQLPLSTAKSDKVRLQDELNVLERNPGLESSLTQADLNGIEANLGYLQKKWRQSVNALSGGGPMPPEPFTDAGSSSWKGWLRGFFGGAEEEVEEAFQGSASGASSSGASGSSSSSSSGGGIKSDMKLKDLRDLALKLSVEILRLQSSGTTDLNINARINTLSKLNATVQSLIAEVETGVRKEEDIPTTKARIAAFLPKIENNDTELPSLFDDTGLSDLLNSLFPIYGAGDASGANTARQLFEEYKETLLNNLSWNVGLNYKGKAEQEIAQNYASAMRDLKLAAQWSPTGEGQVPETNAPAGTDNSSDAGSTSTEDPLDPTNQYRGFLDSAIKSMMGNVGIESEVLVNGKGGSKKGPATGKPPSKLDWKERSTQICDQIRSRGLPAREFGCMENPDKMKDENYSWRGYAKMVCNRLSTMYDPSIPELCGCPPPTWPGWRA